VKEICRKKQALACWKKHAAALKLQERRAIGEWEQGHRLSSPHPVK
jgi:hypothetical protein